LEYRSVGELSAQHVATVASGATPACKVCGAPTRVYDVVDFSKTCDYALYPDGFSGCPLYYYRCGECAFIFTDFCDTFSPAEWHTHIYNADYARIDPDYVSVRPHGNAKVVDAVAHWFKRSLVGLDYGGGSGLTSKLLRERGYVYDTYDPFGETRLSPDLRGTYNFCSAFEVIEHSPNPRELMQTIVSLATPGRLIMMIGTQTHDGSVCDASRLSWWYVGPRNGHISIYSRRSLAVLAAQFGMTCTCVSKSTHLLTRGYSPLQITGLRCLLFAGKLTRLTRKLLGSG